MRQKDEIAMVADVISGVAYRQYLGRICALDLISVDCRYVSRSIISHSTAVDDLQGSPNITMELITLIVDAGKSLAALWTTCPP
jgi:hypothetical protein